MNKISIGDKLQIQCYKHNGRIHRSWDEALVLDVKKDYIVCGNNKTLVIESDGTTWKTKEPAIMYFFKDKWYNIIVQFKKDGIFYYCNIATPYIIEDGTIKYIDYDLDLRVFPGGEYKYHKKIMHYSDKLDVVVRNSLSELIEVYKKRFFAFDVKNNLNYYNSYNILNSKSK